MLRIYHRSSPFNQIHLTVLCISLVLKTVIFSFEKILLNKKFEMYHLSDIRTIWSKWKCPSESTYREINTYIIVMLLNKKNIIYNVLMLMKIQFYLLFIFLVLLVISATTIFCWWQACFFGLFCLEIMVLFILFFKAVKLWVIIYIFMFLKKFLIKLSRLQLMDRRWLRKMYFSLKFSCIDGIFFFRCKEI